MITVPHWSNPQISYCWQELGVPENVRDWEASIRDAYGEHHRFYHNIRHPRHMLGLTESLERRPEHPGAFHLAVWMHDYVYDVRSSTNEEDSAEAARDLVLACRRGNEDLAAYVSDLILATKHTDALSTDDQRLIVDLDLAILGETMEYHRYAHDVRREYTHDRAFTTERYNQGRAAFLESMLNRRSIYQLPEFRGDFEQRARRNMWNELQTIRQKTG